MLMRVIQEENHSKEINDVQGITNLRILHIYDCYDVNQTKRSTRSEGLDPEYQYSIKSHLQLTMYRE